MKAISDIIKGECQMHKCKEVELEILIDGIKYIAHKIFLYSRLTTNEYFLVIQTDNDYLVGIVYDLHRAEREFSFLSICDANVKEGGSGRIEFFTSKLHIAINIITYTLYNRNIKDKITPPANNYNSSALKQNGKLGNKRLVSEMEIILN